MNSRDRRAQLLNSTKFNGIDFVEIDKTQTWLRVHFLNAVDIKATMAAAPTISGGETIPTVAVKPIAAGDWGDDDGHLVLDLHVAAPGDFSIYTLTLSSMMLDVFFSSAPFSFKAGCPSDVDCISPPAPAVVVEIDAPQIDYLAKDFLSFRQALLDFSSQRYPNWQERSEADFGMMFLEALSAVGDELSYLQDRVAAEASLPTATQRRSALRHARLVDYVAGPTLAASAMLQFEVESTTAFVAAGVQVTAQGPDGAPIVFETGRGLADKTNAAVNAAWNRAAGIGGYWLDDNAKILRVGAVAMLVNGHGHAFQPGQPLLIETGAAEKLAPPIVQIVHLLSAGDRSGAWAQELHDDIFGANYTRIAWQAADAITVARDLSVTSVIGNLVFATQGKTVVEHLVVGKAPPGQGAPTAAIERVGSSPAAPGQTASRPVIKLYTLGEAPAAWLPPSVTGQSAPQPEVQVHDQVGDSWIWFDTLIDAGADAKAFTLDAAAYRPLGVNSDHSITCDYAGDAGDTIRFGDGNFGINPDSTVKFEVRYRLGAGAAGNVSSGSITQIDPQVMAQSGLMSATNPFWASGGADAQSLLSIKRLAPQAFRAVLMRAVLPRDYETAAQSLPWVKRAGTVRRWTGSWLTTFTTPEPKASEQALTADRIGLINLLNRLRMAGSESYAPDPEYVSIDLIVEICARGEVFAAQVKQAVIAALAPTGANAASAFFAVSRFVFGQPLYRSALEAAIQAVPGVDGVRSVTYRLRNYAPNFLTMNDVVAVGANQILRCDNDPSRPNNGALSVIVGGGR